jgi:hypothetical protein
MREIVGAFLFVITVLGAGAALACMLRSSDDEPTTFGRAWLLGIAALSTLLHLPLAYDGQITHRTFALVAIAGLLATAFFFARWRRRSSGTHWGGWIADLPIGARIVVGIGLVAAAFYVSRTELSGVDARSAFALKARILYETGDLTGEDFRDVHRLNFNPGYPLLLPLAEVEMYWFQGGYQNSKQGIVFLCFILAIVSVYAAEIRRFASARVAAYLALFLLMTPMLIECFEGAGLSGSADLLLSGFVLAGTLELYRWCQQPTWQRATVAGLFLGAAIMTKNEGLLWVGACGLTTIALFAFRKLGPGRQEIRGILAGTSILGICAGLHLLSHRTIAASPYYPSYGAALTDWNWLKQLSDRPPQVFLFVLGELAHFDHWGLLWLCVLSSMFLLPRGRVPLEVLGWRGVATIVMALYIVVMVVTPMHLQFQLITSFSRLLLHVFPLSMLIMAEQLVSSGWLQELVSKASKNDDLTRTIALNLTEPISYQQVPSHRSGTSPSAMRDTYPDGSSEVENNYAA